MIGNLSRSRPLQRLAARNRRVHAARIVGSAISDPKRLADWYGNVRGELREVIDATIAGGGEGTALVVKVSGSPLKKLPYYGAGWQTNIEGLAAYGTGADLPAEDRFDELIPAYLDQAAPL